MQLHACAYRHVPSLFAQPNGLSASKARGPKLQGERARTVQNIPDGSRPGHLPLKRFHAQAKEGKRINVSKMRETASKY